MKKLELSPGFLLFLALLCWVDTLGLFWWVLLAMALHELGHLAAIFLLRGKIVSVRLRFADCLIVTEGLRYGQELICALAGPAVNLLCFAAFGRLCTPFAAVSLLLGGFNLLPMLPLDGGRAIHAVLLLLLPPDRADLLSRSISLFTVICILAVCLAGIFYWNTGLLPLLTFLLLFSRLALENGREIK